MSKIDPILAQLRDARNAQDLTLDQVAKLLEDHEVGITGAALGHYERGVRTPRLDTVRKWMAVLGLSLAKDQDSETVPATDAA